MKKHPKILDRVEQYKIKRGINYINSDSSFFKTSKVFFCIFFAWAIIMNLLTILSWSLRIGNDSFKYVSVGFYTLLGCTIFSILGLVLIFTKLNYVGFGVSVVTSAFTVITYAPLLQDATQPLGYKTIFFTRHFIPHAAIFLISLVLLVILIINYVKSTKLYKRIEKTVYEEYVIKKETKELDITWDEYLDTI